MLHGIIFLVYYDMLRSYDSRFDIFVHVCVKMLTMIQVFSMQSEFIF